MGVLVLLPVAKGFAAETGSQKVQAFEMPAGGMAVTVEQGTVLADAGLPDTLRAAVDLPAGVEASTFQRADVPADDQRLAKADGADATSGDDVPTGDADAATAYATGGGSADAAQLPDGVYAVTGTTDQFRVYGTVEGVNDGQPAWYAADRDGNVTGQLVDVHVTWSADGYDAATPGAYTATAAETADDAAAYPYDGATPTATVNVAPGAPTTQPSEGVATGEDTNATTGDTAATGDAVAADPTTDAAGEAVADPSASAAAVSPDLTTNDAYLTEFRIKSVHDGTGPFDTDTDPSSMYYKDRDGNDENDQNGRVRTFDDVTYNIAWTNKNYTEGQYYGETKLWVEAILPADSGAAQWDLDLMEWLHGNGKDGGPTITTKDVTYDFDGDGQAETRSAQVLVGYHLLDGSDSQPNVVPAEGVLSMSVEVGAAKNGDLIKPVFTGWIDHNNADGTALEELPQVAGNTKPSKEHGRVEQITAVGKDVKVTAEPRYNVRLHGSDQDEFVGDYNLDEGNHLALDKGYGVVHGRTQAYGVSLALYNNPGRQLKGVELPAGDITFDLVLESRFKDNTTNQYVTGDKAQIVKDNFQPLVLSWGANSYGIQDGRDVGDNNFVSLRFAAPANRGGGWDAAQDGGLWEASRNGQSISFTVSGYKFDFGADIPFPSIDLWNTPSANTYGTYNNGQFQYSNIGIFSAGKIMLLQPFNDLGNTGSNKGKSIQEEMGTGDGDFSLSIKDVRLRATSASGKPIDSVEDNSNQQVRTDDVVNDTINLKSGVGSDVKSAWTKYLSYRNTWSTADALGYLPPSDIYPDWHMGPWVLNGYDQLVRGSTTAIVLGGNTNNGYDMSQSRAAGDYLAKFDGSLFVPTGKRDYSAPNQPNGTGLEATSYLFATKPDGTNWKDYDELQKATFEDLVYYSSLDQVPAGHVVVAVAVEERPVNGDVSKLKSNDGAAQESSYQFEGVLSSKESDLKKVVPVVISARMWGADAYTAVGGNIPSFAGKRGSDVTLPTPDYFNEDRLYTPVTYNDDGSVSGHNGGNTHGDSLRITSSSTRISKTVAHQEVGQPKNVFEVGEGQRYADFALTPAFDEMPQGLDQVTDVTVVDTLDENMRFTEGSAYVGGTYVQADEPGRPGRIDGGTLTTPGTEVTLANGSTVTLDVTELPLKNDDGTPKLDALGNPLVRQQLTWTFKGVHAKDPLPGIHYTTLIGTPNNIETDVVNHQELDNDVTITSTDDRRDFELVIGNYAKEGIRISKLQESSIVKVSNQEVYDPGDSMGYTMSVANANAEPYASTVIMDTLPYSGDKWGSKFTGDLYVDDFNFQRDSVDNPDDWKAYYTTDASAHGTISKDYAAADIEAGSSTLADGSTVHWAKAGLDANGSVTGISDVKNITAIVFVGDLNPQQTIRFTADLRAPSGKPADLFVNELSHDKNETIAKTALADRKIDGLAWLDANEDGLRGDDEQLIEGVAVTLTHKVGDEYKPVTDLDGNPVQVVTGSDTATQFVVRHTNNKGAEVDLTVTATAKEDGSYLFEGVPADTYGITFASASDALSFAKFRASPVNAAGDDPKVDYDLVDSDGSPLDEAGKPITDAATQKLGSTQIHDLVAKPAEQIHDLSGIELLPNNDQGLYLRRGSVEVHKADDVGNAVDGVGFRLERLGADGKTWEAVATGTTGQGNGADGKPVAKGSAYFGSLEPGRYRLTEENAPEGQTLLASPYEFDLPQQSAEANPSYVEGGQGYFLDVTLDVRNNQVFQMPHSGGVSWPWLVGGAALAVGVGSLAALGARRRRSAASGR